jgi:hypothetical protein
VRRTAALCSKDNRHDIFNVVAPRQFDPLYRIGFIGFPYTANLENISVKKNARIDLFM